MTCSFSLPTFLPTIFIKNDQFSAISTNIYKPQNLVISTVTNIHKFSQIVLCRFPKPQAGGSNPLERTTICPKTRYYSEFFGVLRLFLYFFTIFKEN